MDCGGRIWRWSRYSTSTILFLVNFIEAIHKTVSTLYGFFLAMVLYPEVQRKAQAELDSVIGQDRLPTLEDREQLPFIEAVVKETLRWNTVTPLGAPRAVVEDDVYDGWLIPAGTSSTNIY